MKLAERADLLAEAQRARDEHGMVRLYTYVVGVLELYEELEAELEGLRPIVSLSAGGPADAAARAGEPLTA